MKTRLDLLLVARGLAPTREKAQALILAGNVLVEDEPATQCGRKVAPDAAIRVRGESQPYVSRGGLKLAAALDAFGVPVDGRTALDVGASTGGFTDALLTRGAGRVIALDVGRNQLDWKIRSDPRVTVIEGENARYVKFETVGRTVDVIVVDVSFISLGKVLPALVQFAKKETDWITLIKPQFEVGREKVGKGGIVTDDDARRESVLKVTQEADAIGLSREGLIESPVAGARGNREFLALWRLK